MFKNLASQSVTLMAVDASTGLQKTGDSANMLFYVSKDDGAVTLITAASGVPTEVDATNGKGLYKIALAQAETNADKLLFSGKSTTANIVVVPTTIYTQPTTGILAPATSGRTLVVDASGLADANAVKLGPTGAGTAQTARDIGASVLLSAGSGAGQLDFTSGVVKANLAQILGTALTETAGQIAAAFKKFFDKATPTGTINSIPDAVAGASSGLALVGSNVGSATSVSGAVGSVTGAVGSVTGNVGGNVVGSVASVTARVTANADQFAGQTITAAAGVTLPASVASPTNITAGTITTATNLTNAPTAGDFTATMKTSLSAATPSVTVSDKTGFSLSAAGVLAIWNQLTADAGILANTFGVKLKNWVLGTDSKSLISTDSQAGVVLPRVTLVDTVTTLTGHTPQSGDGFPFADRTVGRGTVGATSPTTTTFTPSTLTPAGVAADQFKGRIIIFDRTTATTALRGQATDITASSAAALPLLTFTALTTAPASGDTFSII